MSEQTTCSRWWDTKLIWEIHAFEKYLTGPLKLVSPDLKVESCCFAIDQRLYWTIQLETYYENLKISLMVERGNVSWKQRDFDCDFEVVLGEPGGANIVNKGRAKYVLPRNDSVLFEASGNELMVPMDKLTGHNDEIYPDGILRVTVDLHLKYQPNFKEGVRKLPCMSQPNVPERSIRKWMAGFYNNDMYSDVSIKCQDKSYPCHKQVLGQSSVFAAMFANQMKETITSEVVISDIDHPVLEMFLKWLYCKPFDLPANLKELLQLINAAEKYDLAELKAECLRKLQCAVTNGNAGELNVLVHRYCQDAASRHFFKDYCQKRQATLMENPAYRQIFIENYEAFI